MLLVVSISTSLGQNTSCQLSAGSSVQDIGGSGRHQPGSDFDFWATTELLSSTVSEASLTSYPTNGPELNW